MGVCAKCAGTFPDASLSHSGDGLVCMSCASDGADTDLAELQLAGVKRNAIVAAGVTALGHFITFRETSSSTELTNGVGQTTVEIGANFPGLLGGGLGLLLALFGAFRCFRVATPTEEGSGAGTQKWVLFTGLVVVALWATSAIFSSLPSTETHAVTE